MYLSPMVVSAVSALAVAVSRIHRGRLELLARVHGVARVRPHGAEGVVFGLDVHRVVQLRRDVVGERAGGGQRARSAPGRVGPVDCREAEPHLRLELHHHRLDGVFELCPRRVRLVGADELAGGEAVEHAARAIDHQVDGRDLRARTSSCAIWQMPPVPPAPVVPTPPVPVTVPPAVPARDPPLPVLPAAPRCRARRARCRPRRGRRTCRDAVCRPCRCRPCPPRPVRARDAGRSPDVPAVPGLPLPAAPGCRSPPRLVPTSRRYRIRVSGTRAAQRYDQAERQDVSKDCREGQCRGEDAWLGPPKEEVQNMPKPCLCDYTAILVTTVSVADVRRLRRFQEPGAASSSDRSGKPALIVASIVRTSVSKHDAVGGDHLHVGLVGVRALHRLELGGERRVVELAGACWAAASGRCRRSR